MLKTFLSVLCVWLGLTAAAFAQDRSSPERLALARDVMLLSGGEAAFTGMMDQLRPVMLQDFRSRGVSEQTANHLIDFMMQEFAVEAPRFVELGAIAYADAFTEDELRAIADFLRTPAGRSMIEHQAEIAGAMAQAGMVIGEEIAARMIERMRQSPPPHTP